MSKKLSSNKNKGALKNETSRITNKGNIFFKTGASPCCHAGRGKLCCVRSAAHGRHYQHTKQQIAQESKGLRLLKLLVSDYLGVASWSPLNVLKNLFSLFFYLIFLISKINRFFLRKYHVITSRASLR